MNILTDSDIEKDERKLNNPCVLPQYRHNRIGAIGTRPICKQVSKDYFRDFIEG